MRKPAKPKTPTEAQARILRRIAQNGGSLCLTLDPEGRRYHDMAGVTVPEPTARILIANGLVTANRDSMYDLDPQSWSIRQVRS